MDGEAGTRSLGMDHFTRVSALIGGDNQCATEHPAGRRH